MYKKLKRMIDRIAVCEYNCLSLVLKPLVGQTENKQKDAKCAQFGLSATGK